MTKIYVAYKNSVVKKEHVTVKANGWVKAYDGIDWIDGERECGGLVHYPPDKVKTIHGEVNYESPRGRV